MGTGDGRKLYMMTRLSCHIYGTWRSKEVEGGKPLRKGDTFYWGRLTPLNTIVNVSAVGTIIG